VTVRSIERNDQDCPVGNHIPYVRHWQTLSQLYRVHLHVGICLSDKTTKINSRFFVDFLWIWHFQR